MPEQIPTALTAEQWEAARETVRPHFSEMAVARLIHDVAVDGLPQSYAAAMAIANAAIPAGDPHKVTWADVEWLRREADRLPTSAERERLARLAEKLAALLPPRAGTGAGGAEPRGPARPSG